MADYYKTFNNAVNPILEPLDNPIIRPLLLIFLTIYGTMAHPALPSSWKQAFDNIFFRIAYMALLIWMAKKDPGIAIVAAVVFIVIINLANGKSAFERFQGLEDFEGPATAIYPGCTNMTVADLLESFKNEKDALLNAMLVSRVPGDVKLTDQMAPLIGTYLLNKGFVLKSPCTPPGTAPLPSGWI